MKRQLACPTSYCAHARSKGIIGRFDKGGRLNSEKTRNGFIAVGDLVCALFRGRKCKVSPPWPLPRMCAIVKPPLGVGLFLARSLLSSGASFRPRERSSRLMEETEGALDLYEHLYRLL